MEENTRSPQITFTIHPDQLDPLISEILEKVFQKITESPENYFPSQSVKLKLLSTEEVANILRLSEPTVRNLCRKGKLRHLRPSGRNIMIRQDQLDLYLKTIDTETNG